MTAQILPFEHWCGDGCGEVLETKGSLTLVRRYQIVMDSGKIVGRLFSTVQEAQEFLNANS